MDKSVAARFWSKVNKNGPLIDWMNSQCWQWIGAGKHYGVFWYNGKNCSSHRISFLMHTGSEPEMVLHKCDNKKCVRPDHLYAGNAFQNMADASERKLLAFGTRNPNVKLNEAKVKHIRVLLKAGLNCTEIAKMFDVSNVSINNIKNGVTWKDVL